MSFVFPAIIVFGATTKCSGRRLISALLRVTNCATKADSTCTIPRHLQAVRATIAAVSGNARTRHKVRLTDRMRRRTGCRSGRVKEQGVERTRK
ncbi:hypothetical protein ALC57_16112 [Trachymyrmex cornetzi]|uniref:Uncharacterized protein n=1 Tax=Trachymyrmex cornetzi TaxID=471704 RepID=A0A151IVH1_9HYME|nr:hypothetical protein ALC57_16112 [Trachymyrmex cornetzi]